MYTLKLNDPDFLPHYGCDISLAIEKGQAIALTGSNGIGKTTLARRFSEDSSDFISYIEQKEMDHFYDRKLSQFKKIFLASRGHQINNAFFFSVWEKFNLHLKEDRLLSNLSGGEAQALKLCLGLCSNKHIFLLDEPSQYLDETSRAHLNNILESKLESGASILLIEHDLTWGKFPMIVERLEVQDNCLKVVRA